ncbi:MAG: tRNA 2-thiouridine(34) synthase MnmA, partial [Pseudomonadota bacterium]
MTKKTGRPFAMIERPRIKSGPPKALVGMSGGVDSSVAAALLVRQGYEVACVTMKIWDGTLPLHEGSSHACYGPGEAEDIRDAAMTARMLGLKHYVVDLTDEYRTWVLEYFRKEYLSGKTPNPCIVCNRELKFNFMLKKASLLGIDFDFFATGHYARVAYDPEKGRYLLKKALDELKDQSYFLFSLSQEQLKKALFPLGSMTKDEVRQFAAREAIPVAEKPESQDFIAGGDYSVLFDQAAIKAGDIVDEQGTVVGKHRGIMHYTVGQRKGLGIAAGKPLYVTRIDAPANRIVTGEHSRLFSRECIVEDVRWSSGNDIIHPIKAGVKIRLKHRAA